MPIVVTIVAAAALATALAYAALEWSGAMVTHEILIPGGVALRLPVLMLALFLTSAASAALFHLLLGRLRAGELRDVRERLERLEAGRIEPPRVD